MPRPFGQHFLLNHEIASEIVRALSLGTEDKVLEIGPGRGFLTEYLIDSGADIVGVEIDTKLFSYLSEKYRYDNFRVINMDILDYEFSGETFNKICGNLPYQIAAKIIEKLLLSDLRFNSCVFMVPVSLADRLTAKTGSSDYSSATVSVSGVAEVTRLRDISADNFDPPPSIVSSLISIKRHQGQEKLDLKFIVFVKSIFSNKRKKIINSLNACCKAEISELERLISVSGISRDLRPQDVSQDKYRRLFNEFVKAGLL